MKPQRTFLHRMDLLNAGFSMVLVSVFTACNGNSIDKKAEEAAIPRQEASSKDEAKDAKAVPTVPKDADKKSEAKAVPIAEVVTKVEDKPKTLIPPALDPALRKQAALLLDEDAAIREKTAAALRKLELHALPYLLEIYLDAAGEMRPQVAPVIGDITLIRGIFGNTYKPAATAMMLEALSHPSQALRQGAAANLLLAAVWGKDSATIIARLRVASKKDEDAGVREQARKSLNMIALDVIANHLLVNTLQEQHLAGHFQKLESIGPPAIDVINKSLRGLREDLAEAEELRRIRIGIGGGENPELLRQINLYRSWIHLAQKTLQAIRANESDGR